MSTPPITPALLTGFRDRVAQEAARARFLQSRRAA